MDEKLKGKILIIDDSESILFLLESILSNYFEVKLSPARKKLWNCLM